MPEPKNTANQSKGVRRGGWPRRIPLYFVSFVLVPLAVLGLAELGLRAAAFGYSTHFFLHRSFDGVGFSVTNKAFYQQFFSLPIDHIWEGSEWQVPDVKPERTCRVFILGSSAAQGWPDPAYSFWRILDLMLRDAYPGVRFEVYSAAHPGVNSHVMLPAARECAKVDPDIFVVYMGNNEVNGPFGAVNARGERTQWSLPYIRARIALTDLRLLQMATGNSRKPWRSTLKAVEQCFALEDPRLKVVTDHFAANLEDICGTAERCGAGLVLCTVGANQKDWWPHTSMHRPGLSQDELARWDQAFQAGVARQAEKNWAAATEAYDRALAIDGAHAELHYRLGQCRFALEEYDQARDHFRQAYERDAFHSRILPAVNAAIEQTAARHSQDTVRLARAAQDLAQESPRQIPGQEFFIDNCHLTFEGNYALAQSVFEQMQPLLARRMPEMRTAGAPPPLDACRERLALTPGVVKEHMRTILNAATAWKWKAPPEMMDRMLALDREAGPDWMRTNAESYRVALEKSPDDYYLRLRRVEALLLLNDTAPALDEAQKLVQYYPYRRDTRRALGTALAGSGRVDEAVREFRAVLSLYPDDAETCLQLGLAQAQAKRPEEALAAFRAALAFDPSNDRAKCGEARLLQSQGDMEGARRAYREGIVLNPRAPEAYEGLDAVLQAQGNAARRAEEWQAVAKELPESARAFFLLGDALLAARQPKEAEQAHLKAATLDPLDPAMQVHLGQVRIELKDYAGAIAPLAAALRMNAHIERAYPGLILAYLETQDPENARKTAEACRAAGFQVPPDLAARLAVP
jgi:tetratricopeptide (TPR) repeat protein